MLILLVTSCGGNEFSFNQENQSFKAKSTYFGHIEVQGIDNNDCYIIKRKSKGKKAKSMILNQIPKDYYIISCSNTDTIECFKMKINSEYEIINRGIYNAAPEKIIVITNENGFLRQKE
mgnify:CR=1 FL=1